MFNPFKGHVFILKEDYVSQITSPPGVFNASLTHGEGLFLKGDGLVLHKILHATGPQNLTPCDDKGNLMHFQNPTLTGKSLRVFPLITMNTVLQRG